ncbi:prenyltransferase/squalene oxidase repeat-containing protein, partial [Streptomyces sp. NPDC005071]
PAAYAQLVVAAHTTGTDARDFGGVDLVERLNATGPKPAAVHTPSPATSDYAAQDGTSDDAGLGVWWLVGIGLAAGAGVGFLISSRRKTAQL